MISFWQSSSFPLPSKKPYRLYDTIDSFISPCFIAFSSNFTVILIQLMSSSLHFHFERRVMHVWYYHRFKMKKWSYLIDAPIIIGNAHSWNALRWPTPSRTQPLNRDPTKAPPKHVLTTKPVLTEEKHQIRLWYVFS